MENDFPKHTASALLWLKGLDWYFGSCDMQLCLDHNNNNKHLVWTFSNEKQTNRRNTHRTLNAWVEEIKWEVKD